MSKKLVASLIGWLILAFFLTPSVWAAANKDKKPVAKKQVQAPSATSVAPSSGKYMEEMLKKQLYPRMVTNEEYIKKMAEAKSAESRYSGSVYDAVAGVISESPFFSPGVLTETAPENYDTAGFTYYGINANHRHQRQIAICKTNTNVAMAWAYSATTAISARNVMGTLWKSSSKFGGNFLTNVPMNGDQTGRSAFSGMTYTPKSGRLVIYGHHALGPARRGTYFGAETSPGQFDWGSDINAPDSIAGDADPGIWPTVAGGLRPDVGNLDGNPLTDTIEVIHFFSNQGNTAGNSVDHYIYSRAIDSSGIWVFKGFTGIIGAVVDTGFKISPTVVASKKSSRVALIYTTERACNYNNTFINCSNLYYIESMNGGNDWALAGFNFSGFPGTNITNYDSANVRKVTGDFMGVYDQNDSLVISYTQFVNYDPADGTDLTSMADIYVWTKQWGHRKAADGNFDLMPASTSLPGSFTKSLNYPHIGVHDGTGGSRNNYLYLTYQQFGGNDTASFADTNVEGFLNGEVYVKASTNGGKTWGPGINVTNSKTPACPVPTGPPAAQHGTCSSAMFSSCAERVNDTIHIAYLSDEYAGAWTGGAAGDDNTSATATLNPMVYMKYPAFTPTPVAQISVTPVSFIQNPGSALTDTFLVQNIGNANLTVDSIKHKPSATWLTINNGTAGFTIIEGDPDVAIGFTVNDAALSDGVYYDTVRVYNQSANKPIVSIPVFMIVDNGDDFLAPQWKVMKNSEVTVAVSNVSNVGHQGDTTGLYRIANTIDTTNVLFDASKSIDVISFDGKKYVARYVFDQHFMAPLDTVYCTDTTVTTALPAKPGTTVQIPPGQYRYCRVYYTGFYPGMNGVEWPGPWWGLKIFEEWWLPKTPSKPWDPKFLLWCQTISFNQTPPSWWANVPAFNTSNTTIYINKAMDWDVFSTRTASEHIGGIVSDNYGWANKSIGAAWVEGVEDTIPGQQTPNGYIGFVGFLDGSLGPTPWGVHIVSNPSYIYPNSGYVDAELYDIQADSAQDPDTVVIFTDTDTLDLFKYVPLDTFAKDTLPTDLNIVMTEARILPPYPVSGVTFYNVLGVIGDTARDANKSCDSLARAFNQIRDTLGLSRIGPADSTLARLLNCKASLCVAKPGDANASGTYTLGDVISIVNYIFNKDGCTVKPLCWLTNLLCRGDWNGSGTVSLSDVIQAVNFIFNKPNGPWNALPSGVCCL